MRRKQRRMAGWIAAVVAGVLLAPASARAQGVTVALVPTMQEVAPGAEFDLDIQVTDAGSPFNGFDAVIGYDPGALTLLRLSPLSLQEGSYMKAACGNTFHRFHMGVSSDTITDVLLCNGVALTGPGQIYHLHFQASNTPQATTVRFLPGLQFYNAGLYVNPAQSTDATIGIGVTLDVGPPAAGARLALKVAPNPSHGAAVFTVESDHTGPETLAVFDFQGRLVRRLASGASPAGVHAIRWDGRDEAGARLPPAVYFARLQVEGRAVWCRVALIR